MLYGPAAIAQPPADDPSARTWTLRSGAVLYRLALEDGRLVLDYFGPASGLTEQDGAAAPRRHPDLAGLAEGRSLAPPALRLIAQQARTAAPGVEEVRLTLKHVDLPLEVEARYAAWGDTGVITRDLKLFNRGSQPIRVEASPSAAWALPKGVYTLRYLWGGWGQERQLAVEKLGAGTRRFEQAKGRSTNGYVPWLSLRNEGSGVEYLAELAWSGNWWMEVERRPGTWKGVFGEEEVRAAIGMRHDFGGPLALAPGEEFALPRVALTASEGDFDEAANQMRRYQRRYVIPPAPANRPLLVQFNSWYPLGSEVNSENTKRSVDAAAEVGAEVYVLDSGWYTSGDWSKQLGDYEADRRKFPRGLEELAGYVHGKGMKFGLWVEIENVGVQSRLFREHPEWCLPYEGKPVITGDRCQLDFANPAARRWARGVVDRLVQAYRLDWIKIDYNIDVGDRFDPAAPGRAGRRLSDHLAGYYSWLDELRAAHPNLVVENCASGGLRFDTGIMSHAHTTWVSDNVSPAASLQLRYGCTVQFAPEVCNHWMVGDKESGEVNPAAPPGWWDFMFRVAMNGQFGISSRVWEWDQRLKDRAAANVSLYKRIRGTIDGADVYHLTPAPDPQRPEGWVALQYVAGGGSRSALMAYRLAGGPARQTFRLRGLAPTSVYEVSSEGKALGRFTGAELATAGLQIPTDAEWRAAVLEIRLLPPASAS